VLEAAAPSPPETAAVRAIQAGRRCEVKRGGTIGREGADGAPAYVAIGDPKGEYISSIQVQFESEGDKGYLGDRSLNGTFVQQGSGWQRVLCEAGRERLREQGEDYTDRNGDEPPESIRLRDGDLISLVHPTYGVTFEFTTE
jgi:protein kinase/serine/threonine-protein kinase